MKVKDDDLKRELEISISGKDSQKACAMRLGIGIRRFERLLTRARVHGVEAVLHSNMPGSYAGSFKLEVVNSVISGPLTLGIAESKYNLNKATVKAWVRKYQEGGEEALLEDGRGRRGMGRKKKPRLEDYEPGSMEYLKLENELLRRENELLKKALPLVREKIRNRSHAKSGTSSSEN